MHVNTSVVKALMHLRGIDEYQLCNLVHVTHENLQAWLYDLGEDSESRVALDAQMEILALLGVKGESLRNDVVHYWRIHEPFFSRASSTYWALGFVLRAFGKAQAVYLARESDPAYSLKAKAHFGLKFADFMAILEVTAHPLRGISFDPDEMPDLTWVPDTFGAMLPEADFDMLQPGAMAPAGLHQYMTFTSEMQQWERLREAAMQQGLRAEQVAVLLLGNSSAVQAVEHAAPVALPVQPSSAEQAPQKAEVDSSSAGAPQRVQVADVASPPDVNDDMRLFVTPVRAPARPAAQPVPLRRAS